MRIAITGPESSGKTTLGISLAKALNCEFIAEYAREYFANQSVNYKYTFEDVLFIAHKQYNLIQNHKSQSNNVIFDTEMTVMKIWIEDKFGVSPVEIKRMVSLQRIDLYLLCQPDFPWVFDPLRENPGRRWQLYDKFLNELINSKRSFIELKGTNYQRINFVLKELHLFDK